VLRQLRDALDDETMLRRIATARQGGYRVCVARTDGQVVGVIGFRLQDDLCWGRNLYVDDLVVDASRRRSGVGRALMQYVERIAALDGCAYVRLASGLQREQTHRFYEAIGYHKTSFAFARKISG
jgi:GNAT superfamily N-acetyltransferase